MINPKIFGDYDIRAVMGKDLDMDGVIKITRALIYLYQPKVVAIGRDMRLTSDDIFKTMSEQLLKNRVDVLDLAKVSTDMVYFCAGLNKPDLAIMISASHNPSEYNGFKIVKKDAIAISGDSGIYDIRDCSLKPEIDLKITGRSGVLKKIDLYPAWIDFCFSKVDVKKIKPLTVVVDAGNGMGSQIIERIASKLPLKIIPLYFDLDGSFPNHTPNPLKIENLKVLIQTVKKQQADLGIAFDGDADRISFVDEKGKFISGTITTALLASIILKKYPKATVLYNAVCGRVVGQTVEKLGGKPLRVRVGHTLIKEAMRASDGVFCGEHSGHYYYKDTNFSESALLTFLYILELISKESKPLSELAAQYDVYVQSGEKNFEILEKNKLLDTIESEFKTKANTVDRLDGVSVWFSNWWFNIRPSNTEPLVRLNIEADNQQILQQKQPELIARLESWGAKMLH